MEKEIIQLHKKFNITYNKNYLNIYKNIYKNYLYEIDIPSVYEILININTKNKKKTNWDLKNLFVKVYDVELKEIIDHDKPICNSLRKFKKNKKNNSHIIEDINIFPPILLYYYHIKKIKIEPTDICNDDIFNTSEKIDCFYFLNKK